ncbi:MAG TPA: hypothetical protein VGX97_03440 [bacterium]|nr:hypothetical protein [bacterium]
MTAAIILGLAAAAAWYVLAPLWRRGTAPGRAESAERARLVQERETALRALGDLAFDRATGKMSDADYDILRGRYEAAAIDALRRLDALDASRPRTGVAGPAE